MFMQLFRGLMLWVGLSSSVWATPVLSINDDAGFDSATGDWLFEHEGFELSQAQWSARCGDIAPDACPPANRTAELLRFDRVTVEAASGTRFRIETEYKNEGDFVSEGLSSIAAAPGGYLDWGEVTFRFDAPVNAIAFDLLDVASSLGDTVLTLSTDSGFQAVLFNLPGTDRNEGRLDRIGLYDPLQAFSAFTLGFDCSLAQGSCATDDLVGVDALRFAAVPEPGLWLLLGLGLPMVWGAQRFSRHS
ncbi:MAG: hypothetical protein ABW076_11205 [Candidatus Thiodiazotropha sp.]